MGIDLIAVQLIGPMGAHAVVTILATLLALAVTAGYLIHIARILWVVIDRLVIILGAVQAVTDNSAPAAPLFQEINRDLAQSAAALEASVQRLKERKLPATVAQPVAAVGGGIAPGMAPAVPMTTPTSRLKMPGAAAAAGLGPGPEQVALPPDDTTPPPPPSGGPPSTPPAPPPSSPPPAPGGPPLPPAADAPPPAAPPAPPAEGEQGPPSEDDPPAGGGRFPWRNR